MSFFETQDGRPLPPGQVYQPEECVICGYVVAMERFEAVATKTQDIAAYIVRNLRKEAKGGYSLFT